MINKSMKNESHLKQCDETILWFRPVMQSTETNKGNSKIVIDRKKHKGRLKKWS